MEVTMTHAWRHTFPLTALFPDRLQVGKDRYRVLCPVHLETRPSCIVNLHRTHGWRWHCFACGADGDAIDVLTKRDGLTWREAIEILGGGSIAGGRASSAGQVGASPTVTAEVILTCDACRHETLTVPQRTYRTIGKLAYEYSTSVELEALAAGWELAAGVNACVGPLCLDGLR